MVLRERCSNRTPGEYLAARACPIDESARQERSLMHHVLRKEPLYAKAIVDSKLHRHYIYYHNNSKLAPRDTAISSPSLKPRAVLQITPAWPNLPHNLSGGRSSSGRRLGIDVCAEQRLAQDGENAAFGLLAFGGADVDEAVDAGWDLGRWIVCVRMWRERSARG